MNKNEIKAIPSEKVKKSEIERFEIGGATDGPNSYFFYLFVTVYPERIRKN